MANQEKMTLGQFLQETRKSKGISIDEISRETNVSKRYLVALESDDFEEFPGETYLFGFLNTYADALEVDKERVLSMYRRQVKIEQDVPIEQLVGTQTRKANAKGGKMAAVIGGAILGLLLVVFLIVKIIENRSVVRADIVSPQSYHFSSDVIDRIVNQEFQIGDTIYITNMIVPENLRVIEIQLSRLGISKTLELRVNRKSYHIKEGGVLNIDTSDNKIDDLGIEVFAIENRKIRMAVALLREEPVIRDTATIPSEYKENVAVETVLLTADNKHPVNIRLVSSGAGWVAYSADGDTEQEAQLRRDLEINISFEDKCRVFLGNAGVVKFVVGNKEEKGGALGEVNKSVFYWKTEGGKFHLVRAILK